MKAQCGIGSQVALVAQHWLRPYESGIVVAQQRQALKKWLVQFDFAYPGGGIDGDKVWCDESDFAEVRAADAPGLRRSHAVEECPLEEGTLYSPDAESQETNAGLVS